MVCFRGAKDDRQTPWPSTPATLDYNLVLNHVGRSRIRNAQFIIQPSPWSTGGLARGEDELGDMVDIDHRDFLTLDANDDGVAAGRLP
jgi:hypothetical protein